MDGAVPRADIYLFLPSALQQVQRFERSPRRAAGTTLVRTGLRARREDEIEVGQPLVEREGNIQGGQRPKQGSAGTGLSESFCLMQARSAVGSRLLFYNQGPSSGREQCNKPRGDDQRTKQTTNHTILQVCATLHTAYRDPNASAAAAKARDAGTEGAISARTAQELCIQAPLT